MIQIDTPDHLADVEQESAAGRRSVGAAATPRPTAGDTATPDRLRALFDDNLTFVWRSLRRLGLLDQEADDAAQQVFLVTARRLGDIEEGRERAFLFATALRVASDVRRARARRAEVDDDNLGGPSSAPNPEELVEQKRRREILDEVLDALPEELRVALVLFELEGMSFTEMADCLCIPRGTVASRVRRAREQFETLAERRMSRGLRSGGGS